MTQHHQQLTITVAIFGPDALFENILALLLEREGYGVRLLEAPSRGPRGALAAESLEGADVVLLSPGLKEGARAGFLEAMRSNPKMAAIPALSLSPTLKRALLDEVASSFSWQSLFKGLVQVIEAAPRGAVGAGQTTTETSAN